MWQDRSLWVFLGECGILRSKLRCRLTTLRNKLEYDTALKRKTHGDVAQLGEHHVRNVGAEGSNPFISTMETERVRRCAGPVFCFRAEGDSNRKVETRRENAPVARFQRFARPSLRGRG